MNEQARAPKTVLKIAIIHICLFAFHTICWSPFTFILGYEFTTLPRHLFASGVFILLLDLFIGLSFNLFAKQGVRRFVLWLFFSVYIVTFLAFYSANAVTNYGWGSHIDLTLLGGAVAQVSSFWDSFGDLVLPWAALASLCLALVLYLLWKASESLTLSYGQLFFQSHSDRFSLKRIFILVIPLCYIVAVAWSVALDVQKSDSEAWKGEPIVAMLHTQSSKLVSTPRRLVIATKEQAIRQNYPRNFSFKKRNVILFLVDGLRPSNMQVYGYERPTTPFLQSLYDAKKMRVVREARSPCPESMCGILAALTSKDYPSLTKNSLGINTLLEMQGYQSNFILAADHSWYGLRDFYGKRVGLFKDGTSNCPYGINDDRCLLHHLSSLPSASKQPAFFYFHLMSAHMVGTQLEELQKYRPAYKARFTSREKNPVEIRNGYDNGVLQADYIISKIWKELEAKNYLRDSIVIIAADHGEALGEHGLYGHISHIYEEFIRVPLLVIDSREQDFSEVEHASLLDIAPTVLNRLGLPIPETWMGSPIGIDPASLTTRFYQTTTKDPWLGLVSRTSTGTFKYLARGDSEEVYDLLSDKEESNNLIEALPSSLLSRFREDVEKYFSYAQ